MKETGDPAADVILAHTYGVLVYQEQALQMGQAGYRVATPVSKLAMMGHEISLAMMGHEISRVMMAVEDMARKHPRTT